eukprot:TRINITY_DN4101_c0_g1_i1.p1 TRINITY_DN4101_c0_g1~~TRINITY_DN4101_c0_g1_i1.p1  ORF type:complete len:379 (-),score=91.01 TRINITY_DN4101_c0_g1_i1:938-2074(-)
MVTIPLTTLLARGKERRREQESPLQPELECVCWTPPKLAAPVALPDKGLDNPLGQNNCFVNVVLQALWHLSSFATELNSSETHEHSGDSCVFCALKVIFTNYMYGDTPSIPPSVLRDCLSRCYEREGRFQLGAFDDAAEAFEAVLNELHRCLYKGGDCATTPCLVHRCFSSTLMQQTVCITCAAQSAPLLFDSFTYYIPVLSLLKDHCQEPACTLGTLLARVLEDEQGPCANEANPCKDLSPVKKFLLDPVPQVFVFSLTWPSYSPPPQLIKAVFELLHPDTAIRLGDMFDNVNGTPAADELLLYKGSICFYGNHYACHFRSTTTGKWTVFDDEVVKQVDVWSEVHRLCVAGRYHPSMVFYQRASLDSGQAPATVSML